MDRPLLTLNDSAWAFTDFALALTDFALALTYSVETHKYSLKNVEETSELAKAHFHNGFGLNFVKVEAGHEAFKISPELI